MKKFIHIISVLIATTLIFPFGACKYQVIPEPSAIDRNGTNIDPSDGILPPEKVSASNGNYRSIELNWSPVKNAIQYQIFSALTPYDNFIQIAETTGKETSITIDEDVGITNYYMVKAVNYYGTVSKGSKIVSGSTMDIPIITEIETSADGSSVTINWWMGNCTPETYAADIQFVISCFDTNKQKISGVEQTANGTTDSVTITGLSAKTEYYFTVEAVNLKNTAQKTEKSDFTTTTTAHRIYPDKPLNLEITKGTDSSKVVLSWNLPQAADYYDKKTMIYSTHPVYFKIERKEKDADDSTYKTIADYIGCVIDEGNTTGKKIKFDCATGTTSNAKVTITKSTDENAVTDEIYTNYTSLSKITYEDASAVKGKQYTYKVQSYTDDTKEQITDKSSIATEDGWKLSEIKFRAVSNPDDRIIENDKITAINVNFNLEFNDFDRDYTYVTTYERTNLRTSEKDPEAILFYTNNKAELDNKIYTFRDTETESVQGYYTYKLYVIAPTENEITAIPSEHYEAISSKGKVTVINEASLIPSITNFSIQDGYSNKFLLKWDEVTDENDDIVYTINWTELSGEEPVENTIDLTPEEYTVADGVVTFEHEALSGDIRKYTLDITKQGIPASEEYETICHTLGTPSPVMETYDYQNVTVTWPKVDMATKYEVSAYYENDETKTNIAVYPKFTTDERTGAIICTINKIDGFDDITKSGLPINFTVNAINENVAEANSTDKAITVKTLGPALVNTKAETQSIFTDYLKMSWDKVDGATGYIIYRTKYKYNADCTDWIFDKADYYFYDATEDSSTACGSIKINGEDIAKKRVEVSLQNNTYTFKDKDCDVEDDKNSYQVNQSQISWGLPFGYVVIPVNGSEKDFSFGTDADYLKASYNHSEKGFSYNSAFNADKISTIGYGLNVKAAKSESAEAIKVEWEKPFHTDFIPTLYRKKFSKEENHDYGNRWEKVKTLTNTTKSYEDKLSVEDISTAFVYAVQYQAPAESNFTKSFRENLQNLTVNEDKRYNFTHNKEVYNKGYLLTLADFTAEYGGTGTEPGDPNYYQENVTWNKFWDYEERALGPDSFTINIKNRNLSSTMDWSKVVANVTVTDGVFSKPAPSTAYSDTTIGALDCGITLKPKGLSEGTATETNDILEVLRDAKHFYSVSLTRGDQEPVMQAADNSIYAYRQISDVELCKCVSLIIADALYQTGIPFLPGGIGGQEYKTVPHSGETGNLILTIYGGGTKFWSGNKISWGLDSSSYKHVFESGSCSNSLKALSSDFILTSSKSSLVQGINEFKLYHLPELEISISHESGLSSYNDRHLTFIVGSEGTNTSWNLSIKEAEKTIISYSNEVDFKSIFPFDMGKRIETSVSKYDSTCALYQDDWWN